MLKLNLKAKRIVCILLALTVLSSPFISTAQGINWFTVSNKDLMFFENGECELGRFSLTSVLAFILDKPGINGNRIYTTSVIFRVVGSVLQSLFGSAFSKFFLTSTCRFQEPFKVYREVGLYYEIEYMGKTCYILKSSVELIETQQVAMTASRHDIYAGQSKPLTLKDETEFSKYTWSSSNASVAQYDAASKKVIAKSAGTATIMGTYENKCAYCTVTVIKRWQQTFDAVATENIAFKVGPSNTENNRFTVPKNTQISVRGNVGKWLYIKCTYKQIDYYGFVHYNGSNLSTQTSDSTKGDMLYYATLGWRFPVMDTSNYNYISSPYGPRSVSPQRHVGIDIVGKTSGTIEGKEVVAACSGTVRSTGSSDKMGNYISITTDYVDPTTGNKLVIVYMHLSEIPQYNNNTSVTQGQCIGTAGNTGNSGGAHLHFDVNNENAVCSNSRSGYAYKHSINPMFFFISQSVILKQCSSPNGLYWPGIEE